MDEKNINISKSEEELLEIMENRSHITADQLHNLKEDEECLQACSDLAEIVIEMQKKQNMLAIDVRNELADFHNKHSKNDRRKNTRILLWMAPSSPSSRPGMSMTVCIGIQLRPPSVDLRMTKLMWLGASLLIAVRWSAPAISVPRTVRISEGMR